MGWYEAFPVFRCVRTTPERVKTQPHSSVLFCEYRVRAWLNGNPKEPHLFKTLILHTLLKHFLKPPRLKPKELACSPCKTCASRRPIQGEPLHAPGPKPFGGGDGLPAAESGHRDPVPGRPVTFDVGFSRMSSRPLLLLALPRSPFLTQVKHTLAHSAYAH